jgi:hypothetical protein
VLAMNVTCAKDVSGCPCRLIPNITMFLRREVVLNRIQLARTQRSATDLLDEVIPLSV